MLLLCVCVCVCVCVLYDCVLYVCVFVFLKRKARPDRMRRNNMVMFEL